MPPPHNLVELRLVNCQTQPVVMRDLVSTISHQTIYLRTLALVQMNQCFSLDSVAELVKNSEYLQDLDLSGNNLKTMDFAPLLKVLAVNKVLYSVNLSCNRIIRLSN